MAVVPPFITIHAGPHPDLVLGVVPVFPFSQQPSQPEASALLPVCARQPLAWVCEASYVEDTVLHTHIENH